jgi:hypothetical protein
MLHHVGGQLTIRSAWMLRRKCGEIVHLAIDDDPAVVCSGVLVDLSDRYLGVRHRPMLCRRIQLSMILTTGDGYSRCLECSSKQYRCSEIKMLT